MEPVSVSNRVFFDIPERVYVDEDYNVKPPPYGTIDKLMASLNKSGPLIAEAKLGPNAYTKAPFKLKGTFKGQAVWGWKPGEAKEYAQNRSVLIVGAKKEEKKAYVYYALAIDVTGDKSSLILSGFLCFPLLALWLVLALFLGRSFSKAIKKEHLIC